MTTRLPAAARRRQLLDVAVDTFAQRGFHATSVSDVATAAGVTKPVLYQHFESKRTLYLEALNDVALRLRQAIEKATADAPTPRAQVERGLKAFFRFVAEERAAFTLLFGGGTRRDEEFATVAAESERSIAQSIAALLEVPGLAPTDRELLAFGIVGLAEGVARKWRPGDDDADRVAALVAHIAWSGLRGLDPQTLAINPA